MQPNERSARSQRGYILYSPEDDCYYFRIYTSEDKRQFKDYKLQHYDLEVEIVDNYSSFYDIDEKGGYLDYPSKVLGKLAKAHKEA
jgi:hypothetical protein